MTPFLTADLAAAKTTLVTGGATASGSQSDVMFELPPEQDMNIPDAADLPLPSGGSLGLLGLIAMPIASIEPLSTEPAPEALSAGHAQGDPLTQSATAKSPPAAPAHGSAAIPAPSLPFGRAPDEIIANAPLMAAPEASSMPVATAQAPALAGTPLHVSVASPQTGPAPIIMAAAPDPSAQASGAVSRDKAGFAMTQPASAPAEMRPAPADEAQRPVSSDSRPSQPAAEPAASHPSVERKEPAAAAPLARTTDATPGNTAAALSPPAHPVASDAGSPAKLQQPAMPTADGRAAAEPVLTAKDRPAPATFIAAPRMETASHTAAMPLAVVAPTLEKQLHAVSESPRSTALPEGGPEPTQTAAAPVAPASITPMAAAPQMAMDKAAHDLGSPLPALDNAPSELGATLSQGHPANPGSATAAAPAPASQALHPTAQSVAGQIAFSVAQNPDGQTEIMLSPEELGRVRLNVQSGDGSISVTIHAERPETLDLMRRNIELLQRDFRALGYEQMSFSFSQQGFSGQSARHEPEDWDKPAPDPLAIAEVAPTATPPLRPAPALSDRSLDLRI